MEKISVTIVSASYDSSSQAIILDVVAENGRQITIPIYAKDLRWFGKSFKETSAAVVASEMNKTAALFNKKRGKNIKIVSPD